jgi:mono/diheme cytochrome c family protein
MKNLFSVFLVSLFILNSCYYDKADTLYPSVACDTSTTVSYTQKIVPIFQNSCYGCHSSPASGGGILMGSHNLDKIMAINGSLYGSVAHGNGYSPMPKGASKLTACQLLLIKRWIDNGSLNN